MSTHAEVSPVTATLTLDTLDTHSSLLQQRIVGGWCIPKRNSCRSKTPIQQPRRRLWAIGAQLPGVSRPQQLLHSL